jgi:choline dehydrogenase-like flavoprotein
LTVATRLSQNFKSDCILVIEAGSDGRSDQGIVNPGKRGSTFGTKYDWNLTTIPQVYAGNRSIRMTRGKVLGGSSALNLMVWDRGAKPDYDAWENLGNPGWNWRNIYRSMLKVENFTSSSEYGIQGVAQGGYIQTLINRIIPTHQLSFVPAVHILGIANNTESLNGHPVGVSRQPSNIRESDYSRSYSTRYLEHANTNLVLRLNIRVARVNFNTQMKATGVTLEDGAIISSSKEVIISAGTFQSSGLLELSGIGNKNTLVNLGIQTRYHLPGVGENLHDHPRATASYILKPGFVGVDRLKFNTTFAAEQIALYDARQPSKYDYTGSGFIYVPWSSVSSAAQSSIKTLARQEVSASSPVTLKKELQSYSDPSVPQIEVIFSDGLTSIRGYPAPGDPLYGIETFTLIGGLMHPFSRGSVHITSSNISAPPLIDPKYLSSPTDQAAHVMLSKYLRKIANTAPLKDVWSAEFEPGASVQTDAQWEAYSRTSVSTFYHPVGTCAMLPEKEGGVVSPELKVYGTKGLRVVDASVIPLLVSGHIQTAVYGIAERASDLIVTEWS